MVCDKVGDNISLDMDKVLILVLMEYDLRHLEKAILWCAKEVLILVLMEYDLRQHLS